VSQSLIKNLVTVPVVGIVTHELTITNIYSFSSISTSSWHIRRGKYSQQARFRAWNDKRGDHIAPYPSTNFSRLLGSLDSRYGHQFYARFGAA